MPMVDITEEPSTLVTSREPKSPKSKAPVDAAGNRVLMDAIIIVVIAWALLFLMAFSLKAHNI